GKRTRGKMATTGKAPGPVPPRRRFVCFAVLFGTAALVAGLAWFAWAWLAASGPPPVGLTGADPDVAAARAEARSALRQCPRSGAAWGRLGMVLRAHDFGPEANACFAEAERLDPRDPRWPYLQGLTLLLTDLDAGIAKVRRAVELCKPLNTTPQLRLAEALLA